MRPEGSLWARARVRLALAAALFVLVLVLAVGWFVSRRVTPGDFVVRLAPTAPGARTYQLSLRGPGGVVLGVWGFQDAPGPSILAGLQQKVPWKAVSTQAGPSQPCVTLEAPLSVPAAALAPIETLALEQCCPGATNRAGCPVRRVVR